MPNTEHEDHQLFVLDVVDDSVVADANAKLTVTTLQLDASRRTRVTGKRPNRFNQSTGRRPVEFPKSLGRRGDVTDRVRHRPDSKAKLAHEGFVGDSPLFTASLIGTSDVGLIFQRLHRTVEELGRHNHGTATRSARRDLHRLSLRRSDVVALLATELGQGYGSHDHIVQLVQVVLKWRVRLPDVETERDYKLKRNSTTSPSCMT